MARIIINENQLKVIKESREVTFYEFFVNAKQFLKDLLDKPSDAEPSSLFKEVGLTKGELVNKMKDLGIVKSKENITEVPTEDGSTKLRAKHTIQYSIPRKRFNEKMHELHKEIFIDNGKDYKNN